jgi:hypothetical protein
MTFPQSLHAPVYILTMNSAQEAVTSILAILASAAVLAFSVQCCSDYSSREQEIRKICLQTGHSPIECGVLKVRQ